MATTLSRLVGVTRHKSQSQRYDVLMAVLLLFASAREAAGTPRVEIDAATVSDVLSVAKDRFGPHFASVLSNCKIWLNGEEVHESTPVTGKDEVAVLPPVSGGSQ